MCHVDMLANMRVRVATCACFVRVPTCASLRQTCAPHACCLGTIAHALRDRDARGARAAGGRGVGFDGRWRRRYRTEVGRGSRSHWHDQTSREIPVSVLSQ